MYIKPFIYVESIISNRFLGSCLLIRIKSFLSTFKYDNHLCLNIFLQLIQPSLFIDLKQVDLKIPNNALDILRNRKF